MWLVSAHAGFARAWGSGLHPSGCHGVPSFPRPPVDNRAAHSARLWTAATIGGGPPVATPAPRGHPFGADAPRGGLPELREKATPNFFLQAISGSSMNWHPRAPSRPNRAARGPGVAGESGDPKRSGGAIRLCMRSAAITAGPALNQDVVGVVRIPYPLY